MIYIFKKVNIVLQIDKVTFGLIAYWILIFYIGQLWFLNVTTHPYRFINNFKIRLYRLLSLKWTPQLYVRYIMFIPNNNWLSFRITDDNINLFEQFEIIRLTWQSLACTHVITNFSIILALNSFFISFFLGFFFK